MDAGVIVAIISVVAFVLMGLLAHIVGSFFWAGGVTAKLNILMKAFDDINKNVNTIKDQCFTKAEAASKMADSSRDHEAMWTKIDKNRDELEDLRKMFGQGPKV